MTIVTRCHRCRATLSIELYPDGPPGRRTALSREACQDCRLSDQLVRERGAAIRRTCTRGKEAV